MRPAIILAALILVVGIVSAVFVYRYMDPFNTCVRVLDDGSKSRGEVVRYCATKTSGR